MVDKLMSIADVLNIASQYLNADNLKLIEKAYNVANKLHESQLRKSGDPYIEHPLQVAYILATYHTGPATICAGLMHDLLEDTPYTKEEMINDFNEEIAEIVDGVTKISKLKYMTKAKALAHNHEKLFIAMAKDIRVILVKLVDRLHNMRTIEYQPLDKRLRISQETLDLYAPLAHRMGMYRVKAELEDLSFKVLQPETYKEISQSVSQRKEEREADIDKMKSSLELILKENNINHYEIKGRIKNIYSIHNKMVTKNKTIDEIFDLLALRIIVDNVADCYATLGYIHSMWTPIPRRFKDYIAMPKPNLYQSLHTTVIGNGGKIFEVQIRTFEMDQIAELGVAAHWAYKENSNYSPEKEQLEIAEKLKWYKDLSTYVENNSESDPTLDIKEDLFQANVYVFTPNGDVYELPVGSMPLDFAYRIHTEVGNRCVGAIVNGKIQPLSYKLQLGDVVEIKTNKQSNPSESWMKLTKTSHAKSKIRSYLNKIQRDEFVEKGQIDLEKWCKSQSYDINLITDNVASENFSKLLVKSLEDLYCEIGKNTITAQSVLNKILGLTDTKVEEDEYALQQYSEETSSQRTRIHKKNDYNIHIEGLEKAQVKLGNCCQPVFGDKIYGYISKGYGIVIHRLGCPNLLRQSERSIDVAWEGETKDKIYNTTIKILSQDRKNLVADMINIINSQNATIVSVSSTKNINDETVTKFKLQVSQVDDLEHIIIALNNMPESYSVERVFK